MPIILTVTDRKTCVTKDMSLRKHRHLYECDATVVVLTSLHAVNGWRWYREPKTINTLYKT